MLVYECLSSPEQFLYTNYTLFIILIIITIQPFHEGSDGHPLVLVLINLGICVTYMSNELLGTFVLIVDNNLASKTADTVGGHSSHELSYATH